MHPDEKIQAHLVSVWREGQRNSSQLEEEKEC